MTAPHQHTFHPGPPPHAGWWLTSWTGRRTQAPCSGWRWWNGHWWSAPVPSGAESWFAKWAATDAEYDVARPPITWCHYWPAGARVLRADPATGRVTGLGPQP